MNGAARLEKLTKNGPVVLDPQDNQLQRAWICPNGKFVVAQVRQPFAIRLYDLRSGKPVVCTLPGYFNDLNAVAFAPDSKRAFIAGYNGLGYPRTNELWDLV